MSLRRGNSYVRSILEMGKNLVIVFSVLDLVLVERLISKRWNVEWISMMYDVNLYE
jgi:hypothetical protein